MQETDKQRIKKAKKGKTNLSLVMFVARIFSCYKTKLNAALHVFIKPLKLYVEENSSIS